jgi:Cu2+-exporting ATPase
MSLKYSVIQSSEEMILMRVPVLRRRRLLHRKLKYLLTTQKWTRSVLIVPTATLVKIEYDNGLISEASIKYFLNDLCVSKILAVRIPPPDLSAAKEILHLDRHPTLNLAFSAATLAFTLFSKPPLPVLLPILNLASFSIYRRAVEALIREKKFSVDFLDALAHICAQIQKDYSAVAFMTTLISIGDLMRQKTSEKAQRVFTDVLAFSKEKSWVERNGNKMEIPVGEIRKGDLVLIYPGRVAPVDGEVVSGTSMVDQKSLTGESMAVLKSKDDMVYAGTISLDGLLKVCAQRVGDETSVARIVQIVVEGAKRTTAIEDYARKFGDFLVLPALAVSGAIAAITGDPRRFTSMIIIDLGTGMRVSAPTAVLSLMIVAAKSGIIIKGGQSIEKMNEADTVIFDKTGTLTIGQPTIQKIDTLDGTCSETEILQLAASAESRFSHPLARAFIQKAMEMGVEIAEPEEAQYHIGYGVEAKVMGNKILLGSQRFLNNKKVDTRSVSKRMAAWQELAQSVLLLAVDGKLAGLITYSDALRPEAREVVQSLRKIGVKNLTMLTGDNRLVAKSIAGQLDLDAYVCEALPGQKLKYVKDLKEKGHVVVVVGDGINDSPALTIADVGISVRGGADLAKASADVILMVDDLRKIIEAFQLSRDALSLIEKNRKMIFALNSIGFAGAALGLFPPAVTSAVSDGATLLATLSSLKPLARNLSGQDVPPAGEREEPMLAKCRTEDVMTEMKIQLS